jgi:NAD(P)H-flavin reductase
MVNPYVPTEAIIENIIEEAPGIKTFVIKPKEAIKFNTGQFIMLTVPGVGESPFAPSSSAFETESLEISVLKQPRGRNTSALHDMKPGDMVGIRGPFGHGYPLEKFKGRELYVVGGGVGMSPMRSVMLTLLHEVDQYKHIVFRYGARNPELRMYKELCKSWETDPRVDAVYTVDVADETWTHNVGVVTTILKPEDIQDAKSAVSVGCGPPVMLRFMAPVLLKMGFLPENMYFSMEKNMSCGMGMCGHCRLGDYYVCRDGPVFSYDKIKDFPDIWT